MADRSGQDVEAGGLARRRKWRRPSKILIGARHLALPAALAIAVPACAQSTVFSIPAGPLPSAVSAFSRAADVQVFADPAIMRGRRTKGVTGRMTVSQGLEALLRGTGLTSQRRGDVILIVTDDRSPPRRREASPLPARPNENLEAEVSAVTVIGLRAADQRATATKRGQRNIVDVIASDEVRRLPDTTIVDAMRRIPGVSVAPIADNEHPRDIPIAPVVRGLAQAYNNVTINGVAIASTGLPDSASNSATRGVRLDILPAPLVSQLVVIKTFTPDLDPNAIGGAIDLRTRSAFDDQGRPVLLAEAGLATTAHGAAVRPPRRVGAHAAFIASDTFGPERRFGLVVSADYQRLENSSDVHGTSDSGFVAFYDEAGRLVEDGELGNGVPVPQEDRYWSNLSDRRRTSLTARVEADLEGARLSVQAGDYRFVDGFTRNEIVIDTAEGDVSDQTPTSGHFDAASVEAGYRKGVTHNETQVLQASAELNPAPRDQVTLRAGLSRATLSERYDMVKFTAGMNAKGSAVGSSRLAFDYDTSSLHHSFNLPADAYDDLSLYSLSYWRHRQRKAASQIGALYGDWRRNMTAGDEGFGMGGGLAWKRSRFSYAYRNEEYRTSDRSLTLADAGYVSDTPLPFNQAGLRFLAIDPARAWAMLGTNPAAVIATDTTDSNHSDNFTYREETWSGYWQFRYARGPFEVLGGARAEGSAITTRGNVKIDAAWSPITSSSRYAQVLPSVLVNFRPGDGLRLRAGYSRTIGRPSYEAYAPRSSIKFGDAVIGDPEASGIEVSLGNPHIKPRRSDNFDLAFDWSPGGDPNGLVSAAVFHKAIRDEIFDATSEGYDYNGVFYRKAIVTRPANAMAAHISGLELSATIGSLEAVNPLLRHVGVNANWSLLSGAMSVLNSEGVVREVKRLVGQPNQIRNLTLFYDRGGFEVRGAVNWTGLALRRLTPDVEWQDVYWAPRRQFDVQARYHFGPRLSVIVDLANLTGERLTSVTGPGRRWLKDSYSVPRTFRISLNWGLGR